ncbi:hypothetical protein GDO81_019187 [Engystomops pustulosus]|uniref:Tektin n=1 Tax=Engystomops pustulosus TaxID=76066 RepID=A0AAV6ZQZ6_ENGPU|nr:hypothetical protein GDO81_019187 [Engystomops pustulosus]
MSAPQLLVSRPPAPQTVPAQSLPVRTAEAAYNSGEHSSSGLATAGFRTAKYLLEEWQQSGLTSCYQAHSDRHTAQQLRHQARESAAETQARAQRSQEDSTELGGRGRYGRLVSAETRTLLQEKDRLERALHATELPYSIATDNLQCRERRIGGELVRDGAEIELLRTLKEIGDQENNIAALKQAIKDKEAPMKVAQTRLYQRSYRPNVELCRDPVQFRLISEVGELSESVEILKQKLEEAEQSLRNLEDTRMSLEKDIANKANTLFIEREKCMSHRTRYPVVMKLTGYQ